MANVHQPVFQFGCEH